jgi:hypothetical protein
MTDIDLNFLARQNERVLTELRGVRDDMRVLTAMVQRHDHWLANVLEELRAIRQWTIGAVPSIGPLSNQTDHYG